MADEDYEGLPENTPMRYHMISGALAGILEHSVMFPVDSVKTRMQCLSQTHGSLTGSFINLMKTEGFSRSLRGIGAMISGAGPAHALYFACYENVKDRINQTSLSSYYFAPAISGVAATILHDLVMTPADAIKQRLQIFNSPYRNSLDCLTRVLRNEGPSALYRSFMAQFAMNAPYQMTHFVVYEGLQDFLNPNHSYLPWTHSVAGGVAGGLAAAITTPLDVCKTVLNTQEHLILNASFKARELSEKKPLRGLFNSVRLVYNEFGILGFYRGVTARCITCIPGAAISWSVYEYFKWRLRDEASGNNRTNEFFYFKPSTIVAAHSSDQK